MQRALALALMGRREEAAPVAAEAASSLSGFAAKDRVGHAQVLMSAWLACATALDTTFPSTVGLDRMNAPPHGRLRGPRACRHALELLPARAVAPDGARRVARAMAPAHNRARDP